MKNRQGKIIIFFIFTVLLLSFLIGGGMSIAFAFEQSSGLSITGEQAGYGGTNLADASVPEIIGLVIRTLLLFIGVFYLILTMYAGFKWMFSRGNQTDIEIAKKTLINSTIGLIIVILAYAFTAFISRVLSF